MTQEALKLALEALEANDQLINGTGTKGGLVYCMDGYYSDCFDVDPINKKTDKAITAIKEALAQEQEPVAQPASEEDMKIYKTIAANYHKDLSTPPQRTWVGLTDEEIAQGWKESWVTEQAWQSAVWWAEAKLRDKNT